MCKSTDDDRKQMLIHGQVVDVTSFYRRHPGGSVIKQLIDHDASTHYVEFHFRSKRADAVLRSLPQKPATPAQLKRMQKEEDDEVIQDYLRFRKELEDEGWFEPNLLHVAYRCFEVLFMHAVFWNLFVYCYDREYFYASLFWLGWLGIAMGRAGWLMHEMGHYSATGNIYLDRLGQEFFYNFLCGMSASWWRRNHNRHHAYTQHVKYDADLQTLPLVAFTPMTIANKYIPSFGKIWLSLQGILFVPVICPLVAVTWQFVLAPKSMMRIGTYSEMFWYGLRFSTFGYLCQTKFGWGEGFLYYLFYGTVSAVYIFLHFAVSHTHLDAHNDIAKNWIEYSANHTLNICHNPLCNWWMSYLNFQIEHHLFPSMPQYRFPALKPRIQGFLKKHNLPYHYDTYTNAFYRTFSNLGDITNHLYG